MENEPFNIDPDLELDLLFLYYSFADQYGRVDTISAAKFASSKFGILIDPRDFRIDQRHVDVLMDAGIIPDTRLLFNKIALMPAPKKPK